MPIFTSYRNPKSNISFGNRWWWGGRAGGGFTHLKGMGFKFPQHNQVNKYSLMQLINKFNEFEQRSTNQQSIIPIYKLHNWITIRADGFLTGVQAQLVLTQFGVDGGPPVIDYRHCHNNALLTTHRERNCSRCALARIPVGNKKKGSPEACTWTNPRASDLDTIRPGCPVRISR